MCLEQSLVMGLIFRSPISLNSIRLRDYMNIVMASEKSPNLQNFGNRLRSLRLVAGLSQEELADKAEIDRSYLGSVERGEHNLALKNIYKLSKALNVNPAAFFENNEVI
jgi:ribosome-binding protein aMBF1 (putative translation factor)